MSLKHPRKIMPLIAILACAGCDALDPALRDDVWRPTGANAGNIAAMVADPADLAKGRGSTVSDTKASSIAVEHIWEGQPQPLRYGGSSGSSGSGSSGSGSSSGGGAPFGAPGT